MSDISVEELAVILEEDDKWLTENYNKLIQQYPGEMVAINDGKVVAVGREVRDYCAARQKAGLVGPLLINVPHPDDLEPFLI